MRTDLSQYFDDDGVAYLTTGEYRIPREGECCLYEGTFRVDNRGKPGVVPCTIVVRADEDEAGRRLFQRVSEEMATRYSGYTSKAWGEVGPQMRLNYIERAAGRL